MTLSQPTIFDETIQNARLKIERLTKQISADQGLVDAANEAVSRITWNRAEISRCETILGALGPIDSEVKVWSSSTSQPDEKTPSLQQYREGSIPAGILAALSSGEIRHTRYIRGYLGGREPSAALSEMTDRGEITRVSRGRYQAKETAPAIAEKSITDLGTAWPWESLEGFSGKAFRGIREEVIRVLEIKPLYDFEVKQNVPEWAKRSTETTIGRMLQSGLIRLDSLGRNALTPPGSDQALKVGRLVKENRHLNVDEIAAKCDLPRNCGGDLAVLAGRSGLIRHPKGTNYFVPTKNA